MSRHRMNTLTPCDDFEAAAEAYEHSDTFTVDALEHLNDIDVPDDIVTRACELYRESTAFATRVNDALDGEQVWS